MDSASWLSRVLRGCLVRVLRALDVLPSHVGIVMDGNRRFARQHGFASVKSGHTSGFEAMSRVLDLAYSAGVPEVTLYAFSIENFNRTPAEVADLMDIARERLRQLIEYGDIADRHGVRINIVGRLGMLPDDVRDLANDIMESTRANSRATLNLCMPYTARDDMAQALAAIAAENPPHVNESTVREHLYTRATRPLDLLIRTSDTTRLSDFLLWEATSQTYLDFVPQLWPAYTPWCFVCSIMRWRISRDPSAQSLAPEPTLGEKPHEPVLGEKPHEPVAGLTS